MSPWPRNRHFLQGASEHPCEGGCSARAAVKPKQHRSARIVEEHGRNSELRIRPVPKVVLHVLWENRKDRAESFRARAAHFHSARTPASRRVVEICQHNVEISRGRVFCRKRSRIGKRCLRLGASRGGGRKGTDHKRRPRNAMPKRNERSHRSDECRW